LKNTPFCSITALGKKFNPRNTESIPPVKIFVRLELKQNWALFKGLEVGSIRLEAFLKIGFWFKVKAAARFQPEEYFQYFEDWNRVPNAEIEPKDIFKIASSGFCNHGGDVLCR